MISDKVSPTPIASRRSAREFSAPALSHYPDGHEEFVRGAVFSELDVRALAAIYAVGDDPLVSNRTGGIATTSSALPALRRTRSEARRHQQRQVAGLSAAPIGIHNARIYKKVTYGARL